MPVRDTMGRFVRGIAESIEAGATPVGPGSVAGQAVGGAGTIPPPTDPGWKIADKLKGAGGGMAGWGPWIWLLLAQLGVGSLQKKGHQMKMMDIESQALSGMAEQVTPESAYYKAMMPKAQEQNQMAQAFLLQQLLGGGGGGPQLATGEELIGGR